MRALVMELKIMIHLGRHENVVNLLGAVTKNIEKRKNYVHTFQLLATHLKHFLRFHLSR